MIPKRPVIEEAFDLARSGRYRVPSKVRQALVEKRYTQSELFQLEGRATRARMRALCADACSPASGSYAQPGSGSGCAAAPTGSDIFTRTDAS